MENKTESRKDFFLPAVILISAIVVASAWIYTAGLKFRQNQIYQSADAGLRTKSPAGELKEKASLSEGVMLPVSWGDLGVQMVNAGVIDRQKFESLYAGRGGLRKDERKLLEGTDNGNLKITSENSGFLLNLFWALGLGTENEILERGPMTAYDGRRADSFQEALAKAENFASTGGWTLARGGAMSHYSRHPFVVLTSEQQRTVEQISKSIYRPCCDNSTHFPDCNHGMAMLGLLEIMASQGLSQEEMYEVALLVNSYWFPDTYSTIAAHMKNNGVDWEDVNPRDVLGINFSSASGYQRVVSQLVQPTQQRGGGGCGI